jgi:hypothetical protein
MFDAFLSKQGIRSLRVGSPIVSILEAAAQSDMRNAQDIFNLLTSADLDNATGLALMRIGRQERIAKLEISPATGVVTISDGSFAKISTKLFQGSPAPIVGSTTIHVVDATDWPVPGPDTKIYLGRGTNNYEGPIRYTARTNVGNHWEITLSTATTKFHNTSETVIVAQGGNRVVGPNTTIRTPQANTASAVEFRTLFVANLPDGEVSIPNVEVAAQLAGNAGNVIAGAISEFAGSGPFDGAEVTNPGPFTNGHETESDNDYRERIRDVRASRQLGTTLAITTAVTGITAVDENKRINSAALVKRFGFPSTLYIDDGTGYEERTSPIAIESLMDDAVGGESHFETTQRPIARAFAITTNVAPFVLRSTDKLAVKVGGTTYTHSFDEADFHSISNASAYEVVASINSNPDIAFVARTAEHGAKVVVFANSDVNEDIEVIDTESGTEGNDGLAFPAGLTYTMRLYKNDRLLVKDGRVASIAGLPFAQWDAMTGDQTLSLKIDHTPAISFTFSDQDFINAQTGYATLGRNSLAAWAAVINAEVPGITASENAGRLILTSNAGPVEKASLEVMGGTLVSAHLFGLVSASGAPRDYVLDRNEAQIALTSILEAGDTLTAGSFATRAFLESGELGFVTLANDAKMWFIVDGDAEIIEHGVTASTEIDISIAETNDTGNQLFIEAATAAFVNVQPQDWMVIWDAAAPTSLLGVHRVLDASDTAVRLDRHESSLTRRSGHASVALQSTGTTLGKILTCGGGVQTHQGIAQNTPPLVVMETAELYDPNTKTVTACAAMSTPRSFHTATVVPSGKVVVIGGQRDSGIYLTSIEIYDPALDSWSTSIRTLTESRRNHTATLLTDGRVLIAGGDNGTVARSTYQIYNPVANTITAQVSLTAARSRHSAVKLLDDTVLIAGGLDTTLSVDLATTELFTPGADAVAAADPMTRARSGFGLALVKDPATKAIAVGARYGQTGTDTYEEYVLGTGLWGAETVVPVTGVYEDKPLLRVTNGNVVYLDAYDSTSQTGFVYDGTTFTAVSANALTATMGGPRWYTQLAEIKSGNGTTTKNIVASIGGSFEHSTPWKFQPAAILNAFNSNSGSWNASYSDSAVGGPYFLSNVGIAFVRSDGFVQQVTVPAGTNYTASSLVDVLNNELEGMTASTHKTTRLRINTNRYANGGDISLVTQNVDAEGVLLDATDAIENIAAHVGSVETASSGLGTPWFDDLLVVSQSKNTGTHPKIYVPTQTPPTPDYSLVGLRNWWRGADNSSLFVPGAWIDKRANSNFKFDTTLKTTSHALLTRDSVIETRDAPVQPWGPLDRAYFAAPYAISPNGNLEVEVDNDDANHFSINLWRALTPVGNIYGNTNTFKDGDASGVSLAETFGLDYDFNDFAVFMPARVAYFTGDTTRALLLRYFRLGPDGNNVRTLFGNPDAPNNDLKVVTELGVEGAGETKVTIKLRSGALRTPTVHDSTKVGWATTSISGGGQATLTWVMNLAIASATRTASVTTATLTLPSGITDHGLLAGNNIWVESTNINFSSGLKLITSVTATTIVYDETAADQGATANVGSVSFDSQGEATLTGSGTNAADFFRIEDPNGLVALGNITFQISNLGAGGRSFDVTNGDQIAGTSFSLTTTLVWQEIVDADNFTIFATNPQTSQGVVAAINALRDADGSTCPIKATEIGDGTGLIVQNSPDAVSVAAVYYPLNDGVNWVKTTTSPGSILGDYDLTFKVPITAGLATDTDWANEEIRIVPITTPNIVEWLNTPTIAGLFTQADIAESDAGKRVQITSLTAGSAGGIEVQGGLANEVVAAIVGSAKQNTGYWWNTIARLDGEGMATGMWARIQNENTLPNMDVLHSGLTLSSWTADGQLTFDGPVVDVQQAATTLKVSIEKQGQFVAISDMGASGLVNFGGYAGGYWVRLSAATSTTIDATSTANLGLFRILRVAPSNIHEGAGTLYIENSSAIEEFSECDVSIYSPTSVMPGDQLIILSDVWGANIGTWDVLQVGTTTATSGDPFANATSFVVDVSSHVPANIGIPVALDSDTALLVYIRAGTPATFVLKIRGITLNQDDGEFLDIGWDQPSAGMSGAAGSAMTILDKLEFPTTFAAGSDGYRYDTGLLREANKVVYGDPANPARYPGVAAADAHINIQGPLVKRIQVGLSIRVKSGLNTQDIANRVRSAVATVVNKTAIGQSIAFSDIIDAARDVVGVVSVTIVAPLYSVAHDQIEIQPYEKPYVLDLAQDVQVSFLGV